MCKWGTHTPVEVFEERGLFMVKRTVPVDSCLADLIVWLNAHNIFTAACCCGHGNSPPSILIHPLAVSEMAMDAIPAIRYHDYDGYYLEIDPESVETLRRGLMLDKQIKETPHD